MQKIYLAAPFDMIEQMKTYADYLRWLKFEITSLWLEEQDLHGDTDMSGDAGSTKLDQKETIIGYGIRDLRNILACDTLVEFNPGRAYVRNTRIAELGIALALGKQVIVVGPESSHQNYIDNIFVLLQHGTLRVDLTEAGIKPVIHFDTWEDFRLYAFAQKFPYITSLKYDF